MKKKCIKCSIEKPNTVEFFRKSHGDKFRNGCRECEKKQHKKWLEKNQEKVKEYNLHKKKEYYENNKEKITEYKKQWYEENKSKISEKRKEKWLLEHPKQVIPKGMKLCSSCKETKPATTEYFSKAKSNKDGFSYRCKTCRRQKEYWDNPEEAKTKRKLYYEENKEKVLESTKRYKQENLEWYQNYNKSYYKENEEKMKENSKKSLYRRIEEDHGFKLLQRCRKRLYEAVKGNVKSKRTIELIGCSVEELVKHLESQFQDGMSWDNYGEWHVDHIKPCAMFDFSKEEHQKECFHYTNLQPLWAIDNIRKSAKYEASN